MEAPLLYVPKTAAEWNDLWVAHQGERRVLDHDEAFWNERAKTFTLKDTPSSYTERFLELAAIEAHESVIDVGCGTGNLSIPLGRDGHDVLACDFSAGMLERLSRAIEAEGITHVRPVKLSWEDDWAACGLESNSRDVGLASRSIATRDLRGALRKLTTTVRRRCCVTVAVESSPRVDDRMLKELELPVSPSYDAVFALAILQAEGFCPTLDYITDYRRDSFDSFDSALSKYAEMAKVPAQQAGISEGQMIQRVGSWLEGELEQKETDGGSLLVMKQPRVLHWAFIAWDK